VVALHFIYVVSIRETNRQRYIFKTHEFPYFIVRNGRVGLLTKGCDLPEQDPEGPAVDFMEQFRPEFSDKTLIGKNGQMQNCNHDLIWP
jgi:hypothetical protein